METLHVIIPDWGALERQLRLTTPFALWRVADLPLLYNWLDLAHESDFNRVEFHAPASLGLRKSLMPNAELWPVDWDFTDAPAPADAFLVSSLGAETEEFKPTTGWDLLRHHWKLTQDRIEVLWDNFVPTMPEVTVGRGSEVHPKAKLIAPYWIGENCTISADATVGPFASLGDHCVVESGATVRHSHLGSQLFIGRDTTFDGYFIQEGAVLSRERFLKHQRMDPLIVQFSPHAKTVLTA